jgi:hypothetical protein
MDRGRFFDFRVEEKENGFAEEKNLAFWGLESNDPDIAYKKRNGFAMEGSVRHINVFRKTECVKNRPAFSGCLRLKRNGFAVKTW